MRQPDPVRFVSQPLIAPAKWCTITCAMALNLYLGARILVVEMRYEFKLGFN